MDLEEAKVVAEQTNDDELMYSIGLHYVNEKDYISSKEWFGKSADLGNLKAAEIAVSSFSLSIRVNKFLPSWEDVISDGNRILKYGNMVLNAINDNSQDFSIDDDGIESIIENMDRAEYEIINAYFQLKDYQKANMYTNEMRKGNIFTQKALLIKGVCFTSFMSYEVESQNYEYAEKYAQSAIEYFKAVRPESSYIPSTENVEITEQTNFTLAALNFANLYVHGIGTEKNVDYAYKILSSAYNKLEDEGMKEVLADELKKYQKKLLGGYKYIG